MKNPIKAHILRKSETTILVGTANAIILFNYTERDDREGSRKTKTKTNKEAHERP